MNCLLILVEQIKNEIRLPFLHLIQVKQLCGSKELRNEIRLTFLILIYVK